MSDEVGKRRIISAKGEKMKNCVNCGKELTEDYYKCLDNFMQVKYFEEDDQSDNVFCDQYCFSEYMNLERIEIYKISI